MSDPICSTPQIFPGKFLHKVQHDTFCHKHRLPSERPHPKDAAAARRETFRHQQVLSQRHDAVTEVELPAFSGTCDLCKLRYWGVKTQRRNT